MVTTLLIAATLGLTAPRVPNFAADISIDGHLDEAAWSEALTVPLTFETRPGENIDPPVETEVLLIDTGTSLLVGFQARDPDPEAIRAFFRDRDAAYRDDMV
ncbi:MAG: hypothetical protein AAGE01_17925, partial [Pseudomonadota bacterium]